MSKPYRIQVFGKPGCQKCGVLNQRLDKLLADEAWQDFEKQYCNVETEEGLIAFSEAECINPQRIPALLVTRWNDQTEAFEPVPNPAPEGHDPVCKQASLYQYLGLQTDYTEQGRGVITPRMLTTVLSRAQP